MIDMTDKMDNFAKANLTAGQIISYYLDYIPWIGALVTPITLFIAAVYVCSSMAGHTEIIAILSSGVSFRRILFPFFIGALLIAIISFFLTGWLIPNATKSRLAFEVQYLKSKYYFDKKNIHMQVAPNVYLYMQTYNNSNQTGYNFSMERFENNKLMEKLTANRIEWDTSIQKWKLRDWKLKKVNTIFENTNTSDSISLKKTNLKTVQKGDSILQGAVKDTTLIIHPKEFESDFRKYDGMTINELDDYITTLRARGSTGVEIYEVELYTRYSSPFSIFILVFMGAIVSSRKSRGGTGLQIALGFALSFIFIIFFTLFRTFAENGALPPEISVWIPNITFGIITIILYKYVPR